jgi:hypothetical protein
MIRGLPLIRVTSTGARALNQLRKEVMGLSRIYRPPSMVVYGRIEEITLGATGLKPDAIVTLNPPSISINNNSPTCTNNVPSGYCYTINP